MTQQSSNSETTFSWRRAFFVGLAIVPGSYVMAPIFDTFMPIFLQAGHPMWEEGLRAAGQEVPDVFGFGLGASLAFFIMTWDNILGLLLAPWIGARSDRTWNRFGRRKGWILGGMIFMVLGFMLMPFAQSLLALMLFIVISHLSRVFYSVPGWAWWGDLFKPTERSQAGSVFVFMGGIIAIIAFVGSGILFEEVGRAAPFVAGGIFIVLTVLLGLYLVEEPAERAETSASHNNVLELLKHIYQSDDHSRRYLLLMMLLWYMAFNTLQTGISSFAVFELGIKPAQAAPYTAIFTVTLTLFAIPAAWISVKLGRRRALNLAFVVFSLLSATGYLLIQGPIVYALILLALGAITPLLSINVLPLLYDTGEEEEHIGLYTGLAFLMSQSAAILGPILSGYLIERLASQRIIFACAAVFQALAWLAFKKVRVKGELIINN